MKLIKTVQLWLVFFLLGIRFQINNFRLFLLERRLRRLQRIFTE